MADNGISELFSTPLSKPKIINSKPHPQVSQTTQSFNSAQTPVNNNAELKLEHCDDAPITPEAQAVKDNARQNQLDEIQKMKNLANGNRIEREEVTVDGNEGYIATKEYQNGELYKTTLTRPDGTTCQIKEFKDGKISDVKQIDSDGVTVIMHMINNENEQVVSLAIYKPDGTVDEITKNEYNADGKILVSNKYSDENMENLIETTKFSYYSNGNPKSEIRTAPWGLLEDKKFNEQGKLLSHDEYLGSHDKPWRTETNEYYQDGTLKKSCMSAEVEDFDEETKSPRNWSKKEISIYNEDGKLIEEEIIRTDSVRKFANQHTYNTYSYNAQGEKIEKISYNGSDKTKPISSNKYTYTDNSFIDTEFNAEDKIVTITENIMDDDGNINKVIVTDNIEKTVRTIEYDEYENVKSEIINYNDGSKEVYIYDDQTDNTEHYRINSDGTRVELEN